MQGDPATAAPRSGWSQRWAHQGHDDGAAVLRIRAKRAATEEDLYLLGVTALATQLLGRAADQLAYRFAQVIEVGHRMAEGTRAGDRRRSNSSDA
jgi:hypothetical protein